MYVTRSLRVLILLTCEPILQIHGSTKDVPTYASTDNFSALHLWRHALPIG